LIGLTGLYDSQGVLRFTGRDHTDCLAYAELFGLEQADYSIESIEPLHQGLGQAVAGFRPAGAASARLGWV
jgi:hypothetical protein